MNPQQPPYRPYPPQQPGWPGPDGQHSGGYPYPRGGYPVPGGQPWPPTPAAPKKHRKWPWVVGVVMLLIIIVGSTSKPSTSSTSSIPTVVNAGPAAAQGQAAAPAPAPAAPTGPATSFSDGTYHVGVDIAPGRYKTPGPSEDSIIKDCYWERTRDDSGQFGSIISNGNAQGPGYVSVKSGEFFQTSGGCTWTKQ